MASPSAHTQVPLSLGTSHSFPLRTSTRSASSSSASALASPTSSPSPFLLTLRILRLVNILRKRVKTHVHARRPKKATSAKVRQDFCQEVERQAFEEVDRYLGRKNHHRQRKGPDGIKHSSSPTTAVTEDAPVPEKSIDWLLHELNLSVNSNDRTLSTVAKDGNLFLNRKAYFHIERLPLQGLTELLIIVKELLDTLRRASPPRRGARTLCEGNEVLDLRLDETYLANLEHLLLCLQDQIICQLVSRCIELVHRHVLECQKDQHKHSEDWFFEFPDARHPLNTTWPWSIRHSLAVIWGVCWMFYDFFNNPTIIDVNGNMVDVQGNVVVPFRVVQQYCNSMQRPASYSPGAGHQGSFAAALASQGPDNTYSAAPLSPLGPHPAWASAGWLPQENFDDGLDQDSTYAAATSGYWQVPPHTSGQQPDFDFQQPLPQRTRTPLTPTIRVTTDFPSGHQQAPQDTAYYSASSGSSLPLQEDRYNIAYHSTHLSPQDTRFMPLLPLDNMNAPVSPVSAHSPRDDATLPELLSRKRSHSEMRGEAESAPAQPPLQSGPRSRAGSVASQAPNSASPTGEGYSPRGSRSFKRGDPPMNADNKYVCNFAPECAGQTFDRKCEWSKHMDKHDRPYRCPHPSCAKLQGFTYSGGLLRHEREVHNKHGGPKEQLMCPHDDCKRHVGKGFTRKENLNEHIRRVHENKSQLSQQPSQQEPLSQYADYKLQLQEAAGGAEQIVEPPVAPMYTTEDADELVLEPSLGKRKRDDVERSPSVDVEDLKHELKRLRAENASKDDRLRRLEAAEAMRATQYEQQLQAVGGLEQAQHDGFGEQGGQLHQDQQV
ncbi:hypothetical protein LTR36_001648 [Oleoguttula mirabilis]|uniref:C2H2-type domain-containing protein n=1 Tax=Oleoguttula mirabilis TaxID=1507867 RepID=A0AAV9JPG9_9PEZI|nr:hypothetical protein LTR36_001648 [Oleoguttula mirabilis]